MAQSTPDWLLVIDMQPAFGHPASPWYVPGYDACAENVHRLVDAFGPRVLFTRFVPPAEPRGSWIAYYAAHPFALDPAHAGLWEVDPRWADRPSVASHRFSKWREAAPRLPDGAGVVICGVSTDCCVLSTVVDANDDGRRIVLAVDACAAGTDALHAAALAIMADRTGLLEMTDTAAAVSSAAQVST